LQIHLIRYLKNDFNKTLLVYYFQTSEASQVPLAPPCADAEAMAQASKALAHAVGGF